MLNGADAAMDQAVHALLAHRADLAALLAQVLAADPHHAAAHALAGFSLLQQGRPELLPRVTAHLAAARAGAATPRDGALAEALAAWHAHGDMPGAAARLEALLARDPHDLMALKLAQGVRFLLGDAAGMRRAVEGVLPRWDAGLPGRGFVLGCHAFALNETGAPARAEAAGREAVAAQPDDIWGAHAVAHVMERDGRAADGLRWIAEVGALLPVTGSFGRHVHWHAALFHLHLGGTEAALDVFDRQVAQPAPLDGRDFANAASLLWRMEAQGVAVGLARWHALAEEAARLADQPGLAFVDLHHVLALASAGRNADLATKLAAMRRVALEDRGTQAEVIGAVGLPAARAIAALARGEAADAVDLLVFARTELHRIGGSAAQRDLFDRMLIVACLGAGRAGVAVALLADRRTRRAFGAWEARCEARLPATAPSDQTELV